MLVLVGVELQIGAADEPSERALGGVQLRGVLRVQIGDAVVQQAHRKALVLVVKQADLSGDLRSLGPQRAPWVRELRRVEAWQLVGAPPDPGRVDRVGDRVAAADVVPGAGEARRDVRLQVGNVARVQRLQHLADDEPLEERRLGDEHVVLDLAAGELCDGLIDRVEGADLNLDPVFLFERVDDVEVDVLDPVVELQRPLLVGESDAIALFSA